MEPWCPTRTQVVSIGPGSEIWGDPQEFHLVNIQHVQQGTEHIYIWGWVDYDDIFDGTERHRTEFCFELMIVGNPAANNPANISTRTYRAHNGTDTECFRKPAPYVRPV